LWLFINTLLKGTAVQSWVIKQPDPHVGGETVKQRMSINVWQEKIFLQEAAKCTVMILKD